MAAKEKHGLNAKQKRFADEYLVDLNGTRAYKKVYGVKSDEVAKANASRLLSKANVAAYIASKQKKLQDKLEVSVERVLKEAARIAFSDPRKLFDEDGNLKPITDLDDDTAAALAGLDIEALYKGKGKNAIRVGDVRKVKLWNKGEALEKLFKHLGLFEKDNKQKTDPVAELLKHIDGRSTGLTLKP